MNNSQIGFSDEFTYNNNPIKYEITQEGTLQLYVEDCARALGVTKNKERKDGTPYKIVRYDEVYEDLVAIEKVRHLGLYKNLDKDTKAEDFMSNLMMSGISDLTLLENMMNNWYKNYKKIS